MAKCENYKLKITLLAEGSLPNSERESVEAHIKVCQSCKTAYDETLFLLGSLKESHLPEPSQRFMDTLSEKVYSELNGKPKVAKIYMLRFRRVAATVASAAAVMIIFFSAALFQHRQSPAPVLKALNNTVAPAEPEDMVAATFTFSPAKLNPPAKAIANVKSKTVTAAAAQDTLSEESQISSSYPTDNDDLIGTVQSLSDDEAKDILEALDQNVPDNNS
jgi:hypothetical protein